MSWVGEEILLWGYFLPKPRPNNSAKEDLLLSNSRIDAFEQSLFSEIMHGLLLYEYVKNKIIKFELFKFIHVSASMLRHKLFPIAALEICWKIEKLKLLFKKKKNHFHNIFSLYIFLEVKLSKISLIPV